MRAIAQFALIFGCIMFVFVRQVYANLLNIDRNTLSGLYMLLMVSVCILLAFNRIRTSVPQLFPVDMFVWTTCLISIPIVLLYWVLGKLDAGQASYAIFYYGFAPCLLYAGLYLPQMSSQVRKQCLLAACLTLFFMLSVGIAQVLGIDFWLFQNDRYLLQPTSFGFDRATGTYGTQIDFGAICFLFFAYWFISWLEKRSLASLTTAIAAFVGVVVSFSRAYIFMAVVVPVLFLISPQQLKIVMRRPRYLAVITIIVVLCSVAFRQLNVISMFMATDEITQASNETRANYLASIPKMFDSFALVGTGPGTQNGPSGIADSITKLVTDFLWLSFLVEFGFIIGGVILISRVYLVALVMVSYFRYLPRNSWSKTALVFSICFFLSSFVNSAFAHMTTISVFYITAGLFLCDYYKRPSPMLAVGAGV